MAQSVWSLVPQDLAISGICLPGVPWGRLPGEAYHTDRSIIYNVALTMGTAYPSARQAAGPAGLPDAGLNAVGHVPGRRKSIKKGGTACAVPPFRSCPAIIMPENVVSLTVVPDYRMPWLTTCEPLWTMLPMWAE